MNFLSTADGRIASIADLLDHLRDATQEYADEPAAPPAGGIAENGPYGTSSPHSDTQLNSDRELTRYRQPTGGGERRTDGCA